MDGANRTDRGRVNAEEPDETNRIDRADRADRANKVDKTNRADRTDRGRAEVEKPDRVDGGKTDVKELGDPGLRDLWAEGQKVVRRVAT